MLNEKLEYEEYTYNLTGYENGHRRIKYNALSRGGDKNFAGLERIMTIIARRFLFFDSDYNDVPGKEECLAAELALFRWLGYVPTDPDKYKEPDTERKKEMDRIFYWLPNYLGKMKEECEAKLKREKNKTNKKKLRNKINNLESWLSLIKEDDYITKRTRSSRDDKAKYLNVIKTERVVANALRRNKLKVFYLVCKDPHFSEVCEKTGKVGEKKKDLLLRTVAAYMLENYYFDLPSREVSFPPVYRYYEKRQQTRFAPLRDEDLTNWHQGLGKIRTESDDGLGAYSYNGKPLVEQPKKYKNRKKIKFNDEWFRKCEWALIDATDNDDALDEYLRENPDHHFYRDDGSCKPLAEDQRYERNN